MKNILKAALPAVVVVLCCAALLTPAEATQPAWQSASAAVPAYFSSSAGIALPVAPIVAPVVLGLPNSTMPPGPQPGMVCSTQGNPNFCSAQAQGEHCSAFNNNGNQCSTFGVNSAECSVVFTNRACSVLPPVQAAGVPSQCSTFGNDLPQRCSAIGNQNNLRCSTKGRGQGQCSTFGNSPVGGQQCSVFNPGSPNRSFCSTKFNLPEIAKNCSTFATATECSIQVGGRGVCTSFGAALPGSCSAFAPGSHCSIMGGPPGNPCVQ